MAHGSTRSRWVAAPFGLPQGSVLGPLRYIIFTADLGPLLAAEAVLSQSYADDLQALRPLLGGPSHMCGRRDKPGYLGLAGLDVVKPLKP